MDFNEAHAQIRAERINKLLQDRDLVLDALGNDPQCVQAAQDLAVTLSQVGNSLDKIDTSYFGFRMVQGVLSYAERIINLSDVDIAAREMVDGLAEDFQNEAWKSVT